MTARRVTLPILVFSVLAAAWCCACDTDDGSDPVADTGRNAQDGFDVAAQGPPGSCASERGCTDYVGSAWSAATVQSACLLLPGQVWSPASCRLENTVGTCVVDPNGANELRVHYSDALFTAAKAERLCQLVAGTWTPAP